LDSECGTYLISATKNSKKFHKTRFWKEKPLDNIVTLGQTTQATLVYIYIRKKKKEETHLAGYHWKALNEKAVCTNL
jgi:hypothetical protein